MKKLKVSGGQPAITIANSQVVWPPAPSAEELHDLAEQRKSDISIKGRTGPISRFENEFLNFLEGNIQYAVTFNSGTSALLAAYHSIGLRKGDHIIGPALTYHAALSPAIFLGAQISLADIDRDTRCINPDEIESLIRGNTRAITVVHQWGHPADMEKILKIARKHRLNVIEDCSHAHGSRVNGQLCGTFGDVAVFSLQANKSICAGEGGILVTNSKEIHDEATLLGHYRDRSRDEIKDNESLQRFWVTGRGLKLRMSPFNAIVAIHSLRRFPEIAAGRKKCLSYFNEQIRTKVPYLQPHHVSPQVDIGAWYGFKPIYIKDKLLNLPREALVEALKAEGMDISAPSGDSLERLPYFNEGPLVGDVSLPVATFIADNALSLPTFYDPDLHLPIIDQYVAALIKVYDCRDELAEWWAKKDK